MNVFFMRTACTQAIAFPVPTVAVEIDTHYQTEHRLVWNDQKAHDEEHIFVYEVSWIPELSVWRWFLRAHGVMPTGGEAYNG